MRPLSHQQLDGIRSQVSEDLPQLYEELGVTGVGIDPIRGAVDLANHFVYEQGAAATTS